MTLPVLILTTILATQAVTIAVFRSQLDRILARLNVLEGRQQDILAGRFPPPPLDTVSPKDQQSRKFPFSGLFGCVELELVAKAMLCAMVEHGYGWSSPLRWDEIAAFLPDRNHAWLLDHCHDDGTHCRVYCDLLDRRGHPSRWFRDRLAGAPPRPLTPDP